MDTTVTTSKPLKLFSSHNLLLITKLTQNTNQQTIRDRFVNHQQNPQTTNRWYVLPSIHIPKLTLQICECNPDKDVISTIPNTQFTLLGPKYMTTKQTTILLSHWKDSHGFGHNTRHILPTLHISSPPPQDFATKVLLLIDCYNKTLSEHKPYNILFLHSHHSPPPPILDNLNQTFHLTHLCFSKPLTCPTNFLQYNSPYIRGKKNWIIRPILYHPMDMTRPRSYHGTWPPPKVLDGHKLRPNKPKTRIQICHRPRQLVQQPN